ncbi:MAG: hypothetical protein Q7J64_06010, partial [Elusimicrobiota bacterium]|nr:hypothetical protein [Elusimicrobiota bacterium]
TIQVLNISRSAGAYSAVPANQALIESAYRELWDPVSGALTLYLDFINLFLSLLRLTGRRRD